MFRYTPGVGRVAAVQCAENLTATCATAFSTSDQALVAGTAALVVHDTTGFAYGIQHSGGTFIVPSSGVYKIIPSVQYLSGGNGSITIWLKVNGVNVANTGTLSLAKNGEEGIITCEYLLELGVNDQVQVWALAQAANGTINYIPGGGSGANAYPASPGVITNMYRIR